MLKPSRFQHHAAGLHTSHNPSKSHHVISCAQRIRITAHNVNFTLIKRNSMRLLYIALHMASPSTPQSNQWHHCSPQLLLHTKMPIRLPSFDVSMSTRPDASRATTCETEVANVRDRLKLIIAGLLNANSATSADAVWSTLNTHIRRRCLRRTAIVLLLFACVAATVAFVPVVNSFALAFARIALIRVVLPVWDWQPLDRDLCMWPKASPTLTSTDSKGANDDVDVQGCDHCERIGNESLRIVVRNQTTHIR